MIHTYICSREFVLICCRARFTFDNKPTFSKTWTRNRGKSKQSEVRGGLTPLEIDGWSSLRVLEGPGAVFCLKICGFFSKITGLRFEALSLYKWLVSLILFPPFGFTHLGHVCCHRTQELEPGHGKIWAWQRSLALIQRVQWSTLGSVWH